MTTKIHTEKNTTTSYSTVNEECGVHPLTVCFYFSIVAKFPSVGQNLASVSSSDKNLSADVHPQVKSWFGEHTKYASNQVGTVFDPRIAEKVGHFTQVSISCRTCPATTVFSVLDTPNP